MAMDMGTPLRAPPLDTFKVYCRRVAGAVGLLAIRVFDRADAETEALALALGDALQMTNILRDLEEDAQLGRLYLPRELLVRAGIVASDPAEVLRHPSLGKACDALADMAEARFTEAERLLAGWPRRRLWTARAMMLLYRRTLEQLRARGWRELGLTAAPAQVGKGVGDAALPCRTAAPELSMAKGTVHVIGAGMAGLAAAVRLADAGRRVIVI